MAAVEAPPARRVRGGHRSARGSRRTGARQRSGHRRRRPSKQQIEAKLAEREALQKKMDAQALNSLKLAPVITKTAEVLAKHLREKITKEPEISAQILRTWIREEES